LQNQKAAAAKEIIKSLIENFGRPTLAPLKQMSDEECERFLQELPSVGKKVARCVMLYSLIGRFSRWTPHCWRIADRLGWNCSGRNSSYVTDNAADHLQDLMPAAVRFSYT